MIQPRRRRRPAAVASLCETQKTKMFVEGKPNYGHLTCIFCGIKRQKCARPNHTYYLPTAMCSVDNGGAATQIFCRLASEARSLRLDFQRGSLR